MCAVGSVVEDAVEHDREHGLGVVGGDPGLVDERGDETRIYWKGRCAGITKNLDKGFALAVAYFDTNAELLQVTPAFMDQAVTAAQGSVAPSSNERCDGNLTTPCSSSTA